LSLAWPRIVDCGSCNVKRLACVGSCHVQWLWAVAQRATRPMPSVDKAAISETFHLRSRPASSASSVPRATPGAPSWQSNAGSSFSVHEANRHLAADEALRRWELAQQARQARDSGVVSNFLKDCEAPAMEVPVVEFVLPPPEYNVGLPSSFDFSVLEIQRSSSRSMSEAVAFVELGRNRDVFAELAARKRDEAIGACIDSACDTLFRVSPKETPISHGPASRSLARARDLLEEAPHYGHNASPLAVTDVLTTAKIACGTHDDLVRKLPASPRSNSREATLPEPLPEPPTEASENPSESAAESAVEVDVDGRHDEDEYCCDSKPISLEDRATTFLARPGRSMFPQTFLAYMAGDSVEYFSSTHQRWIQGNIRIREDMSTSSYSVSIGIAGQMRDNVCLEVLRARLCEGESVEILDRHFGAWLPGRILGKQAPCGTQVGYRVKLEDSANPRDGTPRVIDLASPECVRRRFSPCQQAEIYKGQAEGWCPATVHADADRLKPTSSARSVPHDTMMLSSDALEMEARSCSESQLWKPVPLRLEEDAGDLPLWVPSYLLRSPVKQTRSSEFDWLL